MCPFLLQHFSPEHIFCLDEMHRDSQGDADVGWTEMTRFVSFSKYQHLWKEMKSYKFEDSDVWGSGEKFQILALAWSKD